jgi:hypothetical protein
MGASGLEDRSRTFQLLPRQHVSASNEQRSSSPAAGEKMLAHLLHCAAAKNALLKSQIMFYAFAYHKNWCSRIFRATLGH